jgi:transcriptional regulator with XRE-family HTH domain/tetratricopeptide (TPR) repeat protein
MERRQLRGARVRRGWTLEKAAEHLGVGRNTLWRWEFGLADPYAYNIHRLCTVYGVSAADLDLEASRAYEEAQPFYANLLRQQHEDLDASPNVFTNAMQRDLELRLQCLIYDWLYHKKSAWSLAKLQDRLSQEVESYDHMQDQNYLNHKDVDTGRRDALRRLALLPIQALGLGALATRFSWTPGDILTHCAGGISACEYLAKGQHEDMTLASWALSAYLPVLKTILKESSLHRKEAARLTGQSFLLKAMLSLHRDGPKQAVSYAEQGLSYSKESDYLPLQLTLLQRLAWIYACERQDEQAVEKILEAQYLLEHASSSLPALVQSNIYSGVAKAQALRGQKDEAFAALRLAHDTFAVSSGDDSMISSMIDYNLGHLYMDDGLTDYRLGQYDAALDSFDKVVDLETFAIKVPLQSERVRVEIINHQTLASLKRPRKDMELSMKLWKEGMQGARALHSEQRFSEALSAYNIMEALWSADKRITELRDLIRRW